MAFGIVVRGEMTIINRQRKLVVIYHAGCN